MKVEIPFLSWTGKAALEVEISDDTEGMFWLRAALEVAVKRGANLSGANLLGANLSGADLGQGQKASIPPLFVEGLCWPVMVTDCHIMIGCEVHTTDEWAAFDNERIARMDGCSARLFWGQWKKPLLAMARAHQSKVREE